jgi:hypothetical protein
MSDRQKQACDVCGGVDDHPRHTIEYGGANAPAPKDGSLRAAVKADAGDWAIADLTSRDRTVRHFDCCAAEGCERCQASEEATGGKRGEALDKALTKLNSKED